MRGIDPFYILLFIATIILLIFALLIPAWAVTISELDDKISEIKITMSNNEKIIDEKKELLRIAKATAGTSWTSVQDIETAEKNLVAAEKSYQDARKEYLNLLTEKSNLIKDTKQAEIDKEQEKQLKRIKYNPSGISKLIGIQLSKQCETLLKNNITTTCPTYKQLRQLDSSLPEISGKFQIDNGFYHRGPSPLQNSWKFYNSDPTIRIIVDPPAGMGERIRLITLHPNFDTYLLPESDKLKNDYTFMNYTTTENNFGVNKTFTKINVTKTFYTSENTNTRVIFHDRYVDAKCKESTVNADKWRLLVADTVDYMRNDCDESHTSFVSKEIITMPLSVQDISTSQKYIDEQRLKWIKEFCIFKFQSCK